MKTEQFLIWFSGFCFWAIAVIACAAFCGCAPSEDVMANETVKYTMAVLGVLVFLFGGDKDIVALLLIFGAVLLPGCGPGDDLHERFRAPPPCYHVLVSDCADGGAFAPLCNDYMDCLLTAELFAAEHACTDVEVEPIATCDGISEEGCERIAERCW